MEPAKGDRVEEAVLGYVLSEGVDLVMVKCQPAVEVVGHLDASDRDQGYLRQGRGAGKGG